MIKEDSKQILLSVFGIVLLLIAVLGISYAIFTYISDSKVENILTTGTISMTYTEDNNGISIENAMPISDSDGIIQSQYFDFTVASEISGVANINYEIRAKEISSTNQLSSSNIKLYLEHEDGGVYKPVLDPQIFNIQSNTNINNPKIDTDSMLLYSGQFTNTDNQKSIKSEKFRLRMWVKSDAEVDSESKTFKIKVNVYANA